MSGAWRLSAGEIARLVARRELSAAEVTRSHLDRISAVEPRVDAFLQLLPDRALERALRPGTRRHRSAESPWPSRT
jgi:Asp-tRNA(Asn)/Glu-tRNA(Gln) amidotransferase A subunit family amidase